MVRETLAKSADFTIFVRDRKPFVRFSGKAYVLPRNGQRGIPVLSVNTSAVLMSVYRIGDRNLIDTVLGYDFQRNLSQYQAEQLASERGAKVWGGELTVAPKLNTEVATAFPVDQALGDLKPGVYVMTAAPKDAISNDYDQRASQWFIVSDLGLTAYSGHDGIDVFIHSLASAEPLGSVEVRLVARNNELLAVKSTDKDGFVHFEAGLARGEGGQAPAAIVAADKADYAFLSLKTTAFDLSDRGVAGRQVPTGLDAFVYTERGVYRSGETVHVTSLLRDARGIAAASPLTLVMERPDGVEYRRAVVADQGLGGHSWSVPIVSSASTGTWRVRAYTDPKRPPVGEASFLVEDYVADRIEFDLTSAAKIIPRDAPAQLSVDGHFLYGAPASNLDLAGTVTIAAAKQRPGFAGYAFGLADDEVTAVRQELADLPTTDASGKASFPVTLDKIPTTEPPARSDHHGKHGGIRRARGRAQAHGTDSTRCTYDRRQAGFLRPLARRRRQCRFRRGDGCPRRQDAGAKRPALRPAAGRDVVSMVPAERQLGIRAGQAHRARRQRHRGCRRRQAGADFAAGEMGALSPGSRRPARRTARSPRSPSMPASTRKPTPIRPISWKSRSTRPITNPATP